MIPIFLGARLFAKFSADMIQMFSSVSVGVLLHPNSDRKFQTHLYICVYVKLFDIKLSILTYFPPHLQSAS